jgi:hypothetical protein
LPKPGFSSLLVRNSVYDKAKSAYRRKVKSGDFGGGENGNKKRKKKKSFSRYVNDIIEEAVDSDQILSSSAPVLSKAAVEGHSVVVKDSRLDRFAEVRVELTKDGKRRLLCLLDNQRNCIHVGFAYSVPEIYRMK